MANKYKLPKYIAGVKIPKKWRKKGGKVLAGLDTPLGRQLAAAALIAIGAAMKRAEAGRAARTDEPAPDIDALQDDDRATPDAPADARAADARVDPADAGARFAKLAAGIAATAIVRWAERRPTSGQPGSSDPPQPPRPPRPPAPPIEDGGAGG